MFVDIWIHVKCGYQWNSHLVTSLWWLNVIIPGSRLADTTHLDCAIITIIRWEELCCRLMINAQVWNICALLSILLIYLGITFAWTLETIKSMNTEANSWSNWGAAMVHIHNLTCLYPASSFSPLWWTSDSFKWSHFAPGMARVLQRFLKLWMDNWSKTRTLYQNNFW